MAQQKESQSWDEASTNIFVEHMELEIKNMISDNNYDVKLIDKWIESIIDIAKKQLKKMNKLKLIKLLHII